MSSYFSLQGKNAFITGAASGIGYAVAERMAAAGANVVIADIHGAQVAAEKLNALAIELDVSNEEDFKNALKWAYEQLGELHILVNNAGILGQEVAIAEQTIENFDRMIKVNLQSVHHCLKHAPAVIADNGSIINTSSYNSMIAIQETPHYAVTKAGMNALTRNGAIELGSRGIRVNAVCPAYVESPMAGADEVFLVAGRCCALQRPAKVDDLVGLYHFLAADESSYMTGQSIVIDGGWSAGLTPAAWDQLTKPD